MTRRTSGFGCNAPEFCQCGTGAGIIVPLTTTVVAGTTTSNCDYSVQPTIDNCPLAPMTTLATTTVPTGIASSIPLSAPATISASCYPTVNVAVSPTYNPADVTPAASSFCSSVLSKSPLSSAQPVQAWVPGFDITLILGAGLQHPGSCEGYKDADECMRDMCEIMQQCPGLGGTVNAPCVNFMYKVVTTKTT